MISIPHPLVSGSTRQEQPGTPMASRMGKFSGTRFSDPKTLFLVPQQSFLIRNKVFRPETKFSGQKQSFLPETKLFGQKQSFLPERKFSGQKLSFLPETKLFGQKTLFLVRELCLGTRNKVLGSENLVPENLPIRLAIDACCRVMDL